MNAKSTTPAQQGGRIIPATPLPWRVPDRSVYAAFGSRTILAKTSAHVAEVWNGGTQKQEAADANAAYIVAACNAYPKLIAALEHIAKYGKHCDVVFIAREALQGAE